MSAPRLDRRTFLARASRVARVAAVASLVACSSGESTPPFPPATTPAGAYAHITVAISEGRPRDVFAYLEDEAQWSAHTIQRERRAALERARKSFPADDLKRVEDAYAIDAAAEDGVDVFVRLGKARGWFNTLRKDMSGVARIELADDRATIVTALGTRYSMRRRKGGLWGLTTFTAELADDAQRATRDRQRVDAAAREIERGRALAKSAASANLRGDAGADAN